MRERRRGEEEVELVGVKRGAGGRGGKKEGTVKEKKIKVGWRVEKDEIGREREEKWRGSV